MRAYELHEPSQVTIDRFIPIGIHETNTIFACTLWTREHFSIIVEHCSMIIFFGTNWGGYTQKEYRNKHYQKEEKEDQLSQMALWEEIGSLDISKLSQNWRKSDVTF